MDLQRSPNTSFQNLKVWSLPAATQSSPLTFYIRERIKLILKCVWGPASPVCWLTLSPTWHLLFADSWFISLPASPLFGSFSEQTQYLPRARTIYSSCQGFPPDLLTVLLQENNRNCPFQILSGPFSIFSMESKLEIQRKHKKSGDFALDSVKFQKNKKKKGVVFVKLLKNNLRFVLKSFLFQNGKIKLIALKPGIEMHIFFWV